MEFRIAIAQTCHPEDGDVVALVERYTAEARAMKVEMVVFPESLMSRYEAELGDFLAQSQPLDGPFTKAVDAIAAKHGIWIVYTMNELNPDGKPFNTAIVTDDKGVRRGFYRKVHLFDSATTHESERMSASDELFEPIDTPFGKLGMAAGTMVLGVILNSGGFVAAAASQTAQGQNALISVYTWVPGIFLAFSGLIMFFYRLDSRYPEIIEDLRKRRGL